MYYFILFLKPRGEHEFEYVVKVEGLGAARICVEREKRGFNEIYVYKGKSPLLAKSKFIEHHEYKIQKYQKSNQEPNPYIRTNYYIL